MTLKKGWEWTLKVKLVAGAVRRSLWRNFTSVKIIQAGGDLGVNYVIENTTKTTKKK